MTDKDLTAPEAVERLADSYVIPGMPEDCRPVVTAATLRALSAERDALKAELADAVEVLRKSTIAIDELISDDLGTLDYNSIRNLVHKNRAFLARQQTETDT